MVSREGRGGELGTQCSGYGVSFRGDRYVLKLDCGRWLHSSVNILKTIELYCSG